MSDLIETLRTHHQSLRPLVDLVEAHGRRIAASTTTDWARLAEVFSFVSDYPKAFHHPVERHILEWVAIRGKGTGALVADFAAADERLAIISAELGELLQEAQRGEGFPRRAIGAYARVWAAAQRERLEFEDSLLFPLAEKYLSATDWARLEREWQLADVSEVKRFRQRHQAIAAAAGCHCQALAA